MAPLGPTGGGFEKTVSRVVALFGKGLPIIGNLKAYSAGTVHLIKFSFDHKPSGPSRRGRTEAALLACGHEPRRPGLERDLGEYAPFDSGGHPRPGWGLVVYFPLHLQGHRTKMMTEAGIGKPSSEATPSDGRCMSRLPFKKSDRVSHRPLSLDRYAITKAYGRRFVAGVVLPLQFRGQIGAMIAPTVLDDGDFETCAPRRRKDPLRGVYTRKVDLHANPWRKRQIRLRTQRWAPLPEEIDSILDPGLFDTDRARGTTGFTVRKARSAGRTDGQQEEADKVSGRHEALIIANISAYDAH